MRASLRLLLSKPFCVVRLFSLTLLLFSKAQTWYSTIEQETLALLLALQQFEVSVGSSSQPIEVFTDHNRSCWLLVVRPSFAPRRQKPSAVRSAQGGS